MEEEDDTRVCSLRPSGPTKNIPHGTKTEERAKSLLPLDRIGKLLNDDGNFRNEYYL